MAINKRRFSQEATYARRCLRGRSCARGRVVPCPAPQPGKVSGMGMQDRMPPRMRKKFPHQDSTLPTPGQAVCPTPYQEAAAGPRSCQGDRRGHRRRADSVCPTPCQEAAAGPRSCQGDRRGHRRRAGLPVLPPTRRPQQAPGTARETAKASAAGPVLFALSPARRPQQAPGATRETTGATAAGPVCRPLPYQGAAAGPRSRQGNRRGLRRRGGYFQCQEGL